MDFIYFIDYSKGNFCLPGGKTEDFLCSVKQTPILPISNFISCLFFIANNFEPCLN